MKNPCLCVIAILSFFPLAAEVAPAQQPITGAPPLSSVAGSGFDSVDLANLNVHFSIPVFSRGGKGGLGFAYNLTYDSLVWSPSTSSGAHAWTPGSNWGWAPQSTADTGYITFSTSTTLCYTNGHPNGGSITYINNYIYFDPVGTPHAFSGGLVQVVAPCTGQQVNSFTATSTDNSGLKLNANTSGTNTVTA